MYLGSIKGVNAIEWSESALGQAENHSVPDTFGLNIANRMNADSHREAIDAYEVPHT